MPAMNVDVYKDGVQLSPPSLLSGRFRIFWREKRYWLNMEIVQGLDGGV